MQRLHHLHDAAKIIVIELILAIAGGSIEPRRIGSCINHRTTATDLPSERLGLAQQDAAMTLTLPSGIDRDDCLTSSSKSRSTNATRAASVTPTYTAEAEVGDEQHTR